MADLTYLNIRIFKLLPHRKLLIKLEKMGDTCENCNLQGAG